MKRLWSTPEYSRRQERIRSKRDARARHGQPRGRPSVAVQRTHRPRVETPTVRAPTAFSLLEDPHESIEFCNAVRHVLRRTNGRVRIELDAIERFTIEAVVALRCIMESHEVRASQVSGNLPSDPQVAADLKATGFFHGFSHPPAGLVPPRGLIRTESKDLVFSDLAAELVDFACANTSVERSIARSCWKSMIELMTNTHNHSSYSMGTPGSKAPWRWAASVYCRNGTASFAFVDIGEGVLGTAPHRNQFQRFYANIPKGRMGMLSELFQGLLGSVTRDPGRGKGLPGLRRDARDGLLPGLRILTSDIYGEVRTLHFRNTGLRFKGSVFRWTADLEEN